MPKLVAHVRRPDVGRTAGPPSDPGLDVPMDPQRIRRNRLRRGGPRTPLPLVGLIAVCAGIGVAYVGQIAHATQATYEASQLQATRADLTNEASRLDDQLNRLKATERIVAAAQQLGMQPPSNWAYVANQPVPVVTRAQAQLANDQAPSDPMQGFISAVGAAVGVHDVRSAGP